MAEPAAAPRRAIIVAAGLGRRLRPFTDTLPKCLVPLRGRPLLDIQLAALRGAGVEDVVVVRGYRGEALARPDLRTIDNPDYERNNILLSLLCAEAELDGGAYVGYGDIVYAPDVAAGLRDAPGDIVLVVDRGWERAYQGRTLHPPSEAELCRVDGRGRVTAVGKPVGPEGALGEFIGLCKLSPRGAATVRDAGRAVRNDYRDRPDAPFCDAPAFRKAYLCDLFTHLIAQGVALTTHVIDGRWREIDTTEDYRRAERDIDWL